MGAWNATIFGNDTSLDIKEEFFRRYNLGEEVQDIKNSLLLEEDDEDRFNAIFALAHCMWEVGQLDNEFLSEADTASFIDKKTAEEFKDCVIRVLTKNYEENPDVRTEMTVAEIEKEFLTRVLTR